jgi:hypothetical protein
MLKNNLFAIASLASISVLPLAQADGQFQDDRWYVAPFASYIDTGGDRKASDGWGGRIGLRQNNR